MGTLLTALLLADGVFESEGSTSLRLESRRVKGERVVLDIMGGNVFSTTVTLLLNCSSHGNWLICMLHALPYLKLVCSGALVSA